MKTRRILSILMALVLALGMPLSALADTYYLEDGSIIINAGENGQTVTQKEKEIYDQPDAAPVITQAAPESSSQESGAPVEIAPTANTITITVSDNATANVTLDGVYIDTSDTTDAAIEINGSGSVVIELDGENTVQSGMGYAGVEKNNEGSLTIQDETGTEGSLTATGGFGAAGIGGGNYNNQSTSDITITGGTVEATGGEYGAGIGGGNNGTGSNITISGGDVTATGGNSGAGIGGGYWGVSGSDITITGGEVTAKGGFAAAGIGGGYNGEGSDITITGGDVTANGGFGAAGIGGGKNIYENKGGDGITITDGTVEATGGEGGAGIGGGEAGGGSDITISGGTVEATGGINGAGIGGGMDGNGSDITISGGTVEATGGNGLKGNADTVETLAGGGAGIGGGINGSGDNIAIEKNAQVTATGNGYAADIGDGYSSEATEKQKDKVDLSGLSQFGKVNGVSGSNGSNLGEGSSSGSIGGGSGNPKTVASYKTWTDAAADLGGLKVSDNDGNDLSNVVWLKADSELEITAKENKVSVIGNKADLLQLTVEGVNKINLETNRVNVSVSNEVLNKITGTGGGFQLSTDDTTVNLTATDQNNKKTLDMTLSANKQSGTQAAPDQNVKKPAVNIDFQPNTDSNNSRGTLQVTTNAPDATLTYSEKCAQALADSEFSKLALSVGSVITTVDSRLAAITTENGSGSISISAETVNMNGFRFSAEDSSENKKLSDMVNNIQLTMQKQSQGSSMMVVDVDAKAPLQSASLKVPGSALQSLIGQDVEKTALSINGKTTSFKNSNLLKKIDNSKPGSLAAINVNHLANDKVETRVDKVDENGNVIVSVDSL